MNRITIIGASGHGKVVADIARLNGYMDIVFLDDREDNTQAAEAAGFHTNTLNSPGKREEAVRYLTALPRLE